MWSIKGVQMDFSGYAATFMTCEKDTPGKLILRDMQRQEDDGLYLVLSSHHLL